MLLDEIEPVIAGLDAQAKLDPAPPPFEAMASGALKEWCGLVQRRAKRVADAIRDGARPIIDTLLCEYAAGDEALRDGIRRLLARYHHFAWIAGMLVTHPRQSAIEFLRAELFWVSMNDRWTDSRDNYLTIDALCGRARELGIDIAPLLEEVAAMSRNELDGYRLSTRKIMLDARARQASSK